MRSNWPLGRPLRPGFACARKVRYQNGVRNVSETIGWKSRYVMQRADRESIRGLVTSPAHHEAVDELFQRTQSPKPNVLALATLMVVGGTVFALAIRLMGGPALKFVSGYVVVFLLAIVAYLIAGQDAVRAYGLPYALWALAFGLLISNTDRNTEMAAGRVPETELYIKTGLVLLGAEILLRQDRLCSGVAGLLVAWLVTPCVILFMYFFGTRVLKMPSKALVIIVAAATSVCGVSAAIATAAAAKAKKEELTLAVGMTLIFTVADDDRHAAPDQGRWDGRAGRRGLDGGDDRRDRRGGRGRRTAGRQRGDRRGGRQDDPEHLDRSGGLLRGRRLGNEGRERDRDAAASQRDGDLVPVPEVHCRFRGGVGGILVRSDPGVRRWSGRAHELSRRT